MTSHEKTAPESTYEAEEEPVRAATTPAIPPPAPASDEYQNPRASAALLGQIFEKNFPTGPGALSAPLPKLKRRMVEFLFDGAAGEPEVFMNAEGDYVDMLFTLRALSSEEELNALSGIKGPLEAPFMLAKAMLYKVEGTVLTDYQRDFIWEALGMTGRAIVVTASNSLGSAAGSALGKYQRTFTVI